jgi:putative redox protein
MGRMSVPQALAGYEDTPELFRALGGAFFAIALAGAACSRRKMLLASLAACAGGTLAMLLRRAEAAPTRLEVEARGIRRDEHPTVLTDIDLEFVVCGPGRDPEVVARSLRMAEEQLCPVWAMLKPGTTIRSSFRIVED